MPRYTVTARMRCVVRLAQEMAEIESEHVTKSDYRKLRDGEQDEPPDGDTYNLLWDAVLDEIKAVVE